MWSYPFPTKKAKEYIWSFEYFIAPVPEDPSKHLQSDYDDYIPRVKNPPNGIIFPVVKPLPSVCIGKNVCIIIYLSILYDDGSFCSFRKDICYIVG